MLFICYCYSIIKTFRIAAILIIFEYVMGIFKTKKNKRYNYTPRYWDDKGEGSPYQIAHRFDQYRSTVGKSGNIKDRFITAWDELKQDSDRRVNKRVLIIFMVLIFIFLYLIEFDLSIFTTRP